MVGFERIEPLLGGRKRQSVGGVLPLEPAGPETAEHPAAGHRVQAGQDLRQQRRGPEGDRCDQRAEVDPLGDAGQIAQGDVRLRDRVPGAAHLRDLQQVVHHGDRRRTRPARPTGPPPAASGVAPAPGE